MFKTIILTAGIGVMVLLMSFTSKAHSSVTYMNSLFQQVTEITWTMLENMNLSMGTMPNYGDTIKESLGGRKIRISGFVVPIDSKTYVLSKNVYAHCFFCGNGGPRSVMQIKFKGKLPRLKTDAFVTLEGTFNYNDKDPNELVYSIYNAEIVSKK